VYQATVSEDQEHLQAVLIQWRQEFNMPDITLDEVVCGGCRGDRRMNQCSRFCRVRPCAVAKGIPNCAYCNDYPCEDLAHLLEIYAGLTTGFCSFANGAHANLDGIRARWTSP
jgi:hypothetical protein